MQLILLNFNFAFGCSIDLSVPHIAEASVIWVCYQKAAALCFQDSCAASVNLLSLLSQSDHLACTAEELNTQTRNCVTVFSVQRGLE